MVDGATLEVDVEIVEVVVVFVGTLQPSVSQTHHSTLLMVVHSLSFAPLASAWFLLVQV